MQTPAVDIQNYLRTHYEPTSDYRAATLRISTADLLEKLIEAFPVTDLNIAGLFTILQELGFKYVDAGAIKIEWLLVKKNIH